MRIAVVFVLFSTLVSGVLAQQLWNPLAVDVTRTITKDLFESNAVPYIQPMVNAINATSNARFYDQAFIPSNDSLYFRVSINGMMGNITDNMKWYNPTLDFGPRADVAAVLAQHGQLSFIDGKIVYTIKPTYQDTLGLTSSLIQELLRDAVDSGYFVLPDRAATLFGFLPDAQVRLPGQDQMRELLHNRQEYKLLDSAARAGLDSLLLQLTLPTALTLPPGVDLSTLIAAVPQVEIGSFMGTELLLRFIPPVEFDKNVGKFSFWGVGLRHSISQYFPERWFDLAIQGVYQGTNLTNTVGFTESKLDADATIWSFNAHVSKEWLDVFAVYSGINYERIDVNTMYTYVLPQEVQLQLGLLPPTAPGEPAVPTPEQPGDTKPQVSTVRAGNTNIKWTIGATCRFGPLRLAVDYGVSRFNMITGGLSYTF